MIFFFFHLNEAFPHINKFKKKHCEIVIRSLTDCQKSDGEHATLLYGWWYCHLVHQFGLRPVTRTIWWKSLFRVIMRSVPNQSMHRVVRNNNPEWLPLPGWSTPRNIDVSAWQRSFFLSTNIIPDTRVRFWILCLTFKRHSLSGR